MKKILFMIDTLQGGGAEKSLVNLVENLDKSLFDITVISFCGGVYENKIKEICKYKNIFGKKINFLRFLRLRKIIPHKLFSKLLIGNKYDIVVSYIEGYSAKICSYVENKRKILWVGAVINKDNEEYFTGHFKSLDDFVKAYNSYDYIIGVSKDVCESLKKYNITSNIKNFKNIINIQEIINKGNEKSENLFEGDNLKILVNIGRLAPQKNQIKLLEIFNNIQKYDNNLRLLIIGSGECKNSLEEFVKQNNLDSKVKILGFTNNPYTYMKKCYAYICTSLFEGYSGALADAIILGLPMLTTRCGGEDELLSEGKYGVICDSYEALEDMVKKIIKDKEFYENQKNKSLCNSKRLIKQNENNIKIINDFLVGK